MTSRHPHLYHPTELAFVGLKNSGKTTLICRLMEQLAAELSIAYLKHDAHGFQMDQPGKDTFKAYEAGAGNVTIWDERKSASIKRGMPSAFDKQTQFLAYDLLLVEGFKGSTIEKFVVLDEDCAILQKIPEEHHHRIVGYIGKGQRPKQIPSDRPYFQRDQVRAMSAFVKGWIAAKAKSEIYGLVLTGGMSQRMGKDKALLDYHGKPQALYSYELLKKHTNRTYISSREGQWQDTSISALPQITDRFLGFGPLGGILSAFQTFPDKAWLIVACDLPSLDSDTLTYLISNRDPLKVATCFNSHSNGLPEPLCAIYEPKAKQLLCQALSLGYSSPGSIL